MRHTLTILSLLLMAGAAGAEETYSAKALFFGEDDAVVVASTAPKKAHIGASYFIRLKNPDGSTRDVLTSRKFKSGERFQLGVKVNTPSYIYILNEDPNGKITLIYPQPGHDNFVNAMGVVFLPSQGAFEFDHVPGTEQLLVFVSPKRMPDGMPERVRKLRPDIVSAPSDTPASNCAAVAASPSAITDSGRELASKGISFADDNQCSASAAVLASETYVSKGIAFSDDAAPAAGGRASYVVKTKAAPDTSLFLKIKLTHQ